MTKATAIAAGLVLALPFLLKYLSADKISVDFYRVKKFSLAGPDGMPVLTISLAIKNLSATSFRITGVTGDVLANGRQIGLVDMAGLVVVEPGRTTILDLPVELDIFASLVEVVSLLQNFAAGGSLRFTGSVVADGFTLPINKNFKIGN